MQPVALEEGEAPPHWRFARATPSSTTRRYELTPFFWCAALAIVAGLLVAMVAMLGVFLQHLGHMDSATATMRDVIHSVASLGTCEASPELSQKGIAFAGLDTGDKTIYKDTYYDSPSDQPQLAELFPVMQRATYSVVPGVKNWACATTLESECSNSMARGVHLTMIYAIAAREATYNAKPLCDGSQTGAVKYYCMLKAVTSVDTPTTDSPTTDSPTPAAPVSRLICLPYKALNTDNSDQSILCDVLQQAHFDEVIRKFKTEVPNPCVWQRTSLGAFFERRFPLEQTTAPLFTQQGNDVQTGINTLIGALPSVIADAIGQMNDVEGN